MISGCPLSLLVLNVALEILAIAIGKRKKLKGYKQQKKPNHVLLQMNMILHINDTQQVQHNGNVEK